MYTLLLTDGSTVDLVKGPQDALTKVKGSCIEAVVYTIANKTIDEVKEIFSDESKFESVTVIAEDKSVYAQYAGYQELKSISYDGEASRASGEDYYVVMMTLSNSLDKLIDSWKTSLKEANEKVVETEKTVELNKATVKSVEKKIGLMTKTVDIDSLSVEEAKVYRINESKTKLADYLKEYDFVSSCHKGQEAIYSITSEKQQYLSNIIMIATLAKEAGKDYQPSWNAKGQPCTYDWTLEELQQLVIEIESVVRPLVSQQQKIETAINECNTLEDVKNVAIIYQ